MSRPIRPFLFILPLLAVPLAGCSTTYSRMYSPAKSHFKAPPETEKKSDVDKLPPANEGPTLPPPGGLPGMPPGTPPGELPPAPPPGLDPTMPAPSADPLNVPPVPPTPAPPPL